MLSSTAGAAVGAPQTAWLVRRPDAVFLGMCQPQRDVSPLACWCSALVRVRYMCGTLGIWTRVQTVTELLYIIAYRPRELRIWYFHVSLINVQSNIHNMNIHVFILNHRPLSKNPAHGPVHRITNAAKCQRAILKSWFIFLFLISWLRDHVIYFFRTRETKWSISNSVIIIISGTYCWHYHSLLAIVNCLCVSDVRIFHRDYRSVCWNFGLIVSSAGDWHVKIWMLCNGNVWVGWTWPRDQLIWLWWGTGKGFIACGFPWQKRTLLDNPFSLEKWW